MWQPFERLRQFKSIDGRKRDETKSTLTCWRNPWTCFNSIFCSKHVQSQKLLLEHKNLRYVSMSVRLVVDLLWHFASPFSYVLQSYRLHTEKRCEEPSNLWNIYILHANTFRFQWKWLEYLHVGIDCGVCLRCFVWSAETQPRNVCKQFSAAWMNGRCRPSLLLILLSWFQHFKLKSSEMHITSCCHPKESYIKLSASLPQVFQQRHYVESKEDATA